jgi:hypothetical protein
MASRMFDRKGIRVLRCLYSWTKHIRGYVSVAEKNR